MVERLLPTGDALDPRDGGHSSYDTRHATMSDLPHPVSPVDLIRLGFDGATAEAAAQEIAELVHVVFGPFDPVVAEGWALSAVQAPDPALMRRILGDAADADDPLASLASEREALAMLERHLRPRWSSSRGRALGHPRDLQGQTWSSLSPAARDEVREALRHLRGFWASRVRRHRPKRDDLDTFLRELAEIFVQYGGSSPQVGRLVRPTDVPHSDRSRFIQLAEVVLAGLPPLPSGRPRIAVGERTARGLSERWERIKRHEATGWAGLDESDEGDPPA